VTSLVVLLLGVFRAPLFIHAEEIIRLMVRLVNVLRDSRGRCGPLVYDLACGYRRMLSISERLRPRGDQSLLRSPSLRGQRSTTRLYAVCVSDMLGLAG